MIKLFESDLLTDGRHSSKGNQLKWQNNGYWYKADALGYEGLSECICAKLLEHSSLDPAEFVSYDTEIIEYKKQNFRGCKSRSFLEKGDELITLERLFKNYYGRSLYQAVWSIRGTEERLRFVVSQVEQMTGIRDFGIYLSKMLSMDAFFLNEDRHMHNIAVIRKANGEFRLCPFFDNGNSLMSDTNMDYPLEQDIYTLIPTVKSKTISADFDEQLDAAEKLFGRQLHFRFTLKEAEQIIYNEPHYPDELKKRTADIICEQTRHYPYMFL